MKEIKRGEIYAVDFGTGFGSEQGGTRPSLILQNDIGNRHSPTTIVAAITGRKTKAALPTHVKIMAKGLKTESTVLLEQIRTIDKARLGEYIHYQCWLTSWYQQNANQPAQKQGQYSENHKDYFYSQKTDTCQRNHLYETGIINYSRSGNQSGKNYL